jgi:hypothetical protein
VKVVEEEEKQDRDEEFRPRLRLKQEQGDIQKWHSDYIQLTENPKYISHCNYRATLFLITLLEFLGAYITVQHIASRNTRSI